MGAAIMLTESDSRLENKEHFVLCFRKVSGIWPLLITSWDITVVPATLISGLGYYSGLLLCAHSLYSPQAARGTTWEHKQAM